MKFIWLVRKLIMLTTSLKSVWTVWMGTRTCWWCHCCPTTPENPCIVCNDGTAASVNFALCAESRYLKPCKVCIKQYKFIDAENTFCIRRSWEEALCCPTTPANLFNIFPDGTTAADDFIPFAEEWEHFSCKQNIDTFKLIETESEFFSSNLIQSSRLGVAQLCVGDYVYYCWKNQYCAATPTPSTATTTIYTNGATTSAASTSSDAATISATGNA